MPRISSKPLTRTTKPLHQPGKSATPNASDTAPTGAPQPSTNATAQGCPATLGPITKQTKIAKDAKLPASISLTAREQQVLMWVARGKTSWEISKIILCEECTVNFHCRNIMGKLNVSTRAQALIRAIGLGLFSP